MSRILRITLFTSIALLLSFSTVNAQDGSTQPDQTLLPEIDPQDIEIRSQFQARFPGLRRQPILGFNPEPRVFQVDPNRTPFIESEEAVAASIPVGELDRPEPPEYRALTYSNPRNGFARLGVGSHITPEADIYGISNLGRGQWVSGNINYRSTEGHLDEQNSSFRNFNTDIRSQHRLSDRSTLKLNTGVFSDFNNLPISRISGTIAEDEQGRIESDGVHFGGIFSTTRNSIGGLDISANGYLNQFETTESISNQAGSPNEWGSSFGVDYSWLGSNIEEVFGIGAESDLGGIETIGSEMNSWSVSQFKASYSRLYNYQTDVKASLGAAYVTDAFTNGTFYAAPRVEVTHTLFDGLDLRGLISGSPNHRSLKGLQTQNRFISLEDPMRHQYHLRGLAEVIVEPLSGTTFTGGAGYENIKQYAVFSNLGGSEMTPIQGAFNVNYEQASFLKVYGAFSQQLVADKFWVDVDGFWQRPRLSGGEKIPFVEAIGVRGALSWRPVAQLLLEGWGDFSGSRFNPNGDDLSSYFLLGTKFEISITDNAGIYGKLLNITDQQYEIWDGYRERGFQGFVGITYLF
ncbi:MAG: hypothetical protein WEA58_08455 [Balneolaceae bacterium]